MPLFSLSDRYQSRSDGGWDVPADGSGEGGSDDKYSAFTQIVVRYIMDGAPDEVNLRYVQPYIHASRAGSTFCFGIDGCNIYC